MDADDLQRFRALVTRRLGLRFDDSHLGTLAEALERLSGGRGAATERYLARLEHGGADADAVRALARELTVGETYFFRNADQFRAFTELALPERIAANASARKLRILSAGCASGEETYSLSMAVRARIADPRWEVAILGVDVNPAALEKARAGRYSTWSLRETPPDMEQRWFRPAGRDFILDDVLRGSVRFDERNLTIDDPGLWPPAFYDVIFCRNVIMYFAPDVARAVVARFARALVPSGFLFLGHAETLRGLSHEFHLCHTHETFYYQRRDARAAAAPPCAVDEAHAYAPSSHVPTSATSAAGVESNAAWVETVQRSTARIQELSEQAVPSPPPDATAQVAPRDANPARALGVSRAIHLLERERFAEALDLLDGLPEEGALDPDVLLLRAALLTHSGRIAEAEHACHELRSMDEMSAGAHYLLALCRESTGDRNGASDEHQVAAYLDPDFAMPRLHLGLLARRAGDTRAAQRELRQALALLAREDASRILLFGGGFTREALGDLCRAELRAAGGVP